MDQSRPQQQSEMWIRGVEAIKAFAHPLRLQILKQMEEPTTVKQIAARLDQQPSKLHYHVNLLHNHNLIQVVAQNSVNGIAEHVYQVTARQFKLVNPLIAADEYPDDTASVLLSNLLQEATHNLQQSLAAHEPDQSLPPRYPFVTQKQVRLTDAQLTAFHQKLDQLIQEVTAIQSENGDSEEPSFELTLAFYRHES